MDIRNYFSDLNVLVQNELLDNKIMDTCNTYMTDIARLSFHNCKIRKEVDGLNYNMHFAGTMSVQ